MFFKRNQIPEIEPTELSWQELRDKLNELDLMDYPVGRGLVTQVLKRIMDEISEMEERI